MRQLTLEELITRLRGEIASHNDDSVLDYNVFVRITGKEASLRIGTENVSSFIIDIPVSK